MRTLGEPVLCKVMSFLSSMPKCLLRLWVLDIVYAETMAASFRDVANAADVVV